MASLFCHSCSKTLSLLSKSILSILKRVISNDQVTKFAHQLILPTNAFLNPVVKSEKKANACYATKKATSQTVRKWLAGPGYILFLKRHY